MNKEKKSALKELEKIFFPVNKYSAEEFYKTEGVDYLPHLQSVIIAKFNGKQTLVNQCGKDYELVTNKAIFTPMVEKLESEFGEIGVELKGRSSASRFFVDFIIFSEDGKPVKKKNVGDIFPRVRVNNSYDGGVKFGYEMGFQRLVCGNGLSVPVDKEKNQKEFFMHTPGIGAGTEEQIQKAVTKLMDSTQSFLENASELIKGYQPLKEQTHSTLEKAITRMAEVVEDITYPAKAVEIAAARLKTEVDMGLEISDWLVYNAMNFALYNNPNSLMPVHKADKADHEVLAYLIKY